MVKHKDNHLNLKLQRPICLKRFVFDLQCALFRSLKLYLLFVLFLLVLCSCSAANENCWGNCGLYSFVVFVQIWWEAWRLDGLQINPNLFRLRLQMPNKTKNKVCVIDVVIKQSWNGLQSQSDSHCLLWTIIMDYHGLPQEFIECPSVSVST